MYTLMVSGDLLSHSNMKLMRYLNNYIANCTRNVRTSRGFIVFIIFFSFYTIWFHYPEDEAYSDEMAEEALQIVAEDPRYAEVYRKETHLPKGLKYVLMWTDPEFAPFYFFGKGQKKLIRYNCSVINCYFTADRKFFRDDLTKFDAIVFNGRNLHEMGSSDFPAKRSPKQKYIYVNTESADNYPVCDKIYDDFFNWTATYKLNSDIIFSYLIIKNANGDIVGPKVDMEWDKMDHTIDAELERKLSKKSKIAAWFVSNCASKSGREKFVTKLASVLSLFNETVDVYGQCGKLKCPRYREMDCSAILQRDYYFYLSLENSFAEDYVTEKLLTAVQNDAVPIVYGAGNYSRFLPPGSYIDGRSVSIQNLARLLYNLKHSQKLYKQYFKWKRKYSYHDNWRNRACAICKALNNETLVNTESSYKYFRKWWNPSDSNECDS